MIENHHSTSYSVFVGHRLLTSGSAIDVARAAKAAGDEAQLLIFDDADGRQIDFDLSGPDAEIEARYSTKRGRGRPKLGVVAREVTLLPRHWDWLASQPGGASVALRKLIDGARKASGETDRRRIAQEATYRFMAAIGGDLNGFEEATRALFASQRSGFVERIQPWPDAIRSYALRLAEPAF